MVGSLLLIGLGLVFEIGGCLSICCYKCVLAEVLSVIGVLIAFYALWTSPVEVSIWA